MRKKLNELKRKIVKISNNAKEGHIASAFSILDILWILYDKILKVDPKNPKNQDRDVLILSKGHASLGLYAVLAEKGFFHRKHLESFCEFDSLFGGHPDCKKIPGVEASTGSLGHGLPIGVGMALGFKIRGNKNRVFVIIGDGEANEGTTWESALLSSHHNLSNLTCVVDYNHSTDRALLMGNLVAKFQSFGWEAKIVDGHNHEELYKTLSAPSDTKPLAIIAETIKGKGVSLMENNPEWHHKFPSEEELIKIFEELI